MNVESHVQLFTVLNAPIFQNARLDIKRAVPIDRSSAATVQSQPNFPAAMRDIVAPVGMIIARKISMPGRKNCQMRGLARDFILAIFFLQAWRKMNFAFINPATMPMIGAP